jgi:hypothetical protein
LLCGEDGFISGAYFYCRSDYGAYVAGALSDLPEARQCSAKAAGY